MATWQCPQEWWEWTEWLSAGLHGQCRWRLPILLLGMLFAKGRRTAASWLRAAGITVGFSDYYYFISSVGRKTKPVAARLLVLLLRQLSRGPRVLLALDDTPTKRYGPKVQGAGQQQLRDLWANIGAYHLNLWMHALVELWAWNKSQAKICDRSDSPWDDANRRPSHADRRRALQRTILQPQFSVITRCRRATRKIAAFAWQLVQLAV